MSNLLQLSTTSINLSHIVFIEWMATRDYGHCKTGIRIQFTTGDIFLPSNATDFEEDKYALIVAMKRLTVEELKERNRTEDEDDY